MSVLASRVLALACAITLLPGFVAGAGARRTKRPGKAQHSKRRAANPHLDRPTAARRGPTRQRSRPQDPQHGTRGISDEHVHLRRGDTLETVLAGRGVEAWEARPWLVAASAVYDLRRVRPRHGLTLRFDRATHALEGVQYEIDDRSLLVLERTAGGVDARRAPLPYFTEVKGAAGRIERGLREDAIEAGVPPNVVSEVADIFGWDLDVANDLRSGDEFRILYENIWQTGAPRPEPGKVLGAQIIAGGRSLTAVYFEDEDGNGSYYQPSGDALSRDLLRYPLEFTEISSEFSLLRRHPILRRSRPHLGVDFAAPSGTPVRAVARGTVLSSGWVNQLGRCVRIDHTGMLASTYGHLARIAAGVKEGAVVERGQVIGYVGASGLATGPHLHFALHRGEEYVDPLTVTAASEPRIPDLARRAFERVRAAVIERLASLPSTLRPQTVSFSESEFRRE